MASQGPRSPGTGTSLTIGSGTAWSNPTRITSSDDLRATTSLSPFEFSRPLVGQQFGFTIPAEDVIAGILVEWELNRGTGFAAIERVLLLDGTTVLASKPSGATITTTDTYYAFGGSTDVWGASLTPELVNSASFGVGVIVQEVSFTPVTVGADHVRVTVFYTPTNTAPSIAVAPTVSYGSLTRLGPNNSPATVSFTATDADGDPLTYEIRTAASGGGTLVASGNANSGTPTNVNIAHNASGISEGSNTLYLRVHDGTEWSSDASFTLLVDRTPPTVGTIVVTPNPVVP